MTKRIISLACALLIFCAACPAAYAARYPEVSARAAALMVADSGKLLFSKNAYTVMPMASTTKIMTALLTLEACEPERQITVTDEMVAVEGTSMGLLVGDTVTLRGLVYGMLLQSGNDAATSAAFALAGSTQAFAQMMNGRAAEIGMTSTNFVTPSGLDSEGHGSTAYDMALLACEAVSNPEFLDICSKTSAALKYGNPPYRRTLSNHNRLLYSYDGAVGVKTGFTKKSGRCLVSAAKRNGVLLVAVTLNAGDDWNDHRKLLDYGFSRVSAVALDSNLEGIALKVVGGESSKLDLATAYTPHAVLESEDISSITREIYLRSFEYAPVEAGRLVGTAVYSKDGKVLCEVPILTTQGTPLKLSHPTAETDEQQKRPGFFSHLIRRVADFIGSLKGTE